MKDAKRSSGGKTVWRMVWKNAHTPIADARVVQISFIFSFLFFCFFGGFLRDGFSRFIERTNGFWCFLFFLFYFGRILIGWVSIEAKVKRRVKR